MTDTEYPAGTELFHVCQMRQESRYKFRHWRCSHAPMSRRHAEVFASKMMEERGHVYIVPAAEAGEWGEIWRSDVK